MERQRLNRCDPGEQRWPASAGAPCDSLQQELLPEGDLDGELAPEHLPLPGHGGRSPGAVFVCAFVLLFALSLYFGCLDIAFMFAFVN